ncbi:hypothetical protein GGH91_000593 [Coemansia sp. RSA 2671]|uniref:Uncharacterized protein n=1 Tax=Coemansia linderi TaxID=2663919 RepID=A0ACC1KNZ6_9FUNG|nr:hypothetical protein LPJ60_000854 [Coemansia sp. RSA 2675]KAJ2349775.1 hypothetical protein GGH91_000593 [Coemansia sp. RSA 2671]KAJ2792713.1 hypothetical protein GGI18_000179 [Coemansia linderi]
MTASMPANIRKRSELYAKNIDKRGSVKSSLDPKTEQKHEAERLRKKGLGASTPVHTSTSRRLLVALVAITVGSALYQVLSPMFASGAGSSGGGKEATKSRAALTREQQAREAAAVLKSLNAKAAERYLKSAKTWQPPVMKASVEDEDEDEETPAIVVEGPLV